MSVSMASGPGCAVGDVQVGLVTLIGAALVAIFKK